MLPDVKVLTLRLRRRRFAGSAALKERPAGSQTSRNRTVRAYNSVAICGVVYQTADCTANVTVVPYSYEYSASACARALPLPCHWPHPALVGALLFWQRNYCSDYESERIHGTDRNALLLALRAFEGLVQ